MSDERDNMPKLTLRKDDEYENPFPFIVLSQHTENGYPVFNRHTMQEAWPTEEHAIHCAEVRLAQGYWVTCYTEFAYGVPKSQNEL
jgi:hypothetical protein